MATGRGGKRPGAGRPKGSRSEVTKEQQATISDLARSYTEMAIRALAEVAETGSDSARVAAANSLLDRGYGKPVQSTEHSGPGGGEIPVGINVRFAD